MPSLEYSPSKIFTLEQANAMLPLVRAITSDLMLLSSDVIERRQRLDHLISRGTGAGDVYSDELLQVEAELETDSTKLREYVEELKALGVEPKSFPQGLIDFPSMVDDRLVYLCWQHNEPEVLYWHEIAAGFAGRQPVAASVSE